jgi:hypothetical protein
MHASSTAAASNCSRVRRTRPVRLAALDGYRNSDGGYGWGLEADLRSPESQPAAALHAFEVLEAIAPATAPQAAGLCDWLDSVTLPDGGLPMALPLSTSAGSGPWWSTDPDSSLQITAVVAAGAHRRAVRHPAELRRSDHRLGSKWGVLRYTWVAAKLVLSPGTEAMRSGDGDAQARLIAGAGYDVVALTLATGLSVFKPGRRRRR